MSNFPFEVFVRHRGYRLPYPLHRWHLPEEREDHFASEDFKPSEFDTVSLILYRGQGKGTITLSIEGSPLQMTLAEGEDYKELQAWAPPRDEDEQSTEGLWGRAGLYRIRVTNGLEAWVTSIEVQPHYVTFEQLGRMCADIERLSKWVAYDISPYAPIVGSRMPRVVREDGEDDDPAAQFARLKEAVPEALRTLRFLSTSPQLSLKPTYVATRAGISRRQDRHAMRLEERLNEREEGWTILRTGEVSYDIYENRFVKRLLMELTRRLNQLQTRFMDSLYELERQEDEVRRRLRRQFGDQEERILREEPLWTRPIRNRRSGLRSQIAACGRMQDSLSGVLRGDLLRDVPPLRGIVRPTNVLQHDPQYSRLWSIYRLLRLSDRGESSVAHKFHRRSRPSWELFEMWTAVQVMEACMRDLRFTQVLLQSVAEGREEGVTYLYDTPRPAVLRLAHETEPFIIEVTYGGYVPRSEQAVMIFNKIIEEAAEAEKEDAEQTESSEEHTSEEVQQVNEDYSEGVTEEPSTELEVSDESPILVTPSETSFMTSEEVEEVEPETTSEIEQTSEGESEPSKELLRHLPQDLVPQELPPVDSLLVTRGVQTAPDIQIRFFDAETESLLGVVILDAKYKGGRRIWGREGGRITDDRMALESYQLDIHRREKEEAAVALFSEPADDIILGAYALFPGERFGRDLPLEERVSPDGRLGAIKMSPDGAPTEELSRFLLDAFAQAQIRRIRLIDEDIQDESEWNEPLEPADNGGELDCNVS